MLLLLGGTSNHFKSVAQDNWFSKYPLPLKKTGSHSLVEWTLDKHLFTDLSALCYLKILRDDNFKKSVYFLLSKECFNSCLGTIDIYNE